MFLIKTKIKIIKTMILLIIIILKIIIKIQLSQVETKKRIMMALLKKYKKKKNF